MFSITNTSHKTKIRKAALALKILPYYATKGSGEEKHFPKQLKIMFYSYLEIALCSLQTILPLICCIFVWSTVL